MGQGFLRKLDFTKNGILEKYNKFFCFWRNSFPFSNAYAIQIKLGTNELLKKLLENMSYWQNESEIEKR